METKNVCHVERSSTEEKSLEENEADFSRETESSEDFKEKEKFDAHLSREEQMEGLVRNEDDSEKESINEGQSKEKLIEKRAWQEQEEKNWQEQEERKWLKEDLAGHLDDHVQEQELSNQPYLSDDQEDDDNEDEQEYINGAVVKKEEASDISDDQGDEMDDEEYSVHGTKVKNEDPDFKPSIGDMRLSWEKKFVLLMNKIESFEAIPLENRTEEEQNTLKKLRKKYHKKKIKYPHLARASLSAAPKKMVKPKFHKIKKKSEGFRNLPSSPACFGSGTLASPVVKFYFTAPCPQLGIEAGSEPSLEGKPAFMASQQGFTCRLCELEVSSGEELVEHWQWEMERQGEELGGEEVLDVPHAEVRPAQRENKDLTNGLLKTAEEDMEVNMNLEVKLEVTEGDVFECTECDYRSNKRDSLQRHINIVHSHEMLYCDQCEYKCNKKATLRTHRHRNHKAMTDAELEATYYCQTCDYSCTKKDTLRMHIKRCHSEATDTKLEGSPEVSFPCTECDFMANKKDTLRKHFIREHKPSKDKTGLSCDECEYSCTKAKVLAMHKYRKHDGILPKADHECDQCEYTCSKRELLAIHLHKKHDGIAPESKSCTICSYTTPWTNALRNHIDRMHLGNVKTYYCDQCEFSAKSKGVLGHHETLKHGKEATFMCDLCEFRTSNALYLKSHMLCKHTDNVYYCDQCDFKSTYSTVVRNHSRIHDEANWAQCEFCSYRTPSNGNLKTHTESQHMGIRHPCTECSYIGYLKSDLKKHTNAVHLGTAPIYRCDYCDFSHMDHCRVKKHQLEKHSNVKFACPHCPYTTNWSSDLYKHSKTKDCGPLPKNYSKVCMVVPEGVEGPSGSLI